MKFNAIGGLPRSGSTLLCNILNQNPKFHVSSTSALCQSINALIFLWSSSPEIKSELHADKEFQKRQEIAVRGLIEGWYNDKDFVFDKGRGWGHNATLLKQLYPSGKLILCIRDLRAVFASIEKQNRKNLLLDDAQNPQGKTMYARADTMFSPEGLIGMPLNGIQDILRKNLDNVIILQYEYFIQNPAQIMERVYAELQEPLFKHDFKNVQQSATDLDALYLNKFPHNGVGEVKDAGGSWKEYISDDIATLIQERYASYNAAFGYK